MRHKMRDGKGNTFFVNIRWKWRIKRAQTSNMTIIVYKNSNYVRAL